MDRVAFSSVLISMKRGAFVRYGWMGEVVSEGDKTKNVQSEEAHAPVRRSVSKPTSSSERSKRRRTSRKSVSVSRCDHLVPHDKELCVSGTY